MSAVTRIRDIFLVVCFWLAIVSCTLLLLSGEGNTGHAHHMGDEAQEHHHRRRMLARSLLGGDW